MGSIISWIRATGGWVRSPYGDLPVLRAHDASAHQTWLILAGGVGLILSRASKSELETRFTAARQIYLLAHTRLRRKRLPKPDSGLLRDALQEIANLADPMTREAGRECLERCVERIAAKARASAPPPLSSATAPSTLTATQVLTTQAATTNVEDNEATQIDLDLLFERSNRLRGTVAWARSTTFGQDN